MRFSPNGKIIGVCLHKSTLLNLACQVSAESPQALRQFMPNSSLRYLCLFSIESTEETNGVRQLQMRLVVAP